MTGNEPHAAPRHAVAGAGIDVDAIARAVDHALTKRPTRPRRDVIDTGTNELIGHLRTLMAVEDYGYDQEGRLRDYYADGDDLVVFRKRMN